MREHLTVTTALQLFNSLIVPILTYGSEIWGPMMASDSHDFERVQLRFARFILGVSKKSASLGVTGELGLHHSISRQGSGS